MNERGQSIVLLAFAMVGLLLFAGLAIDAGVIYVGMANLDRAVDAAALAGVVELPHEEGTVEADRQAEAFLGANGISGTLSTSRSSGPLGAYRYAITVTQQIELYFLPLVGLEEVSIRSRAVAEVNPAINLYVRQEAVYGQQATVNLAVFGPDSCTCFGDPVSPRYGRGDGQGNCLPNVPNPWWGRAQGVYHFRLDLPLNYESAARNLTERRNGGRDTNSVVRIEIWDPDSYNASDPGCGGDRRQPCTPQTGDAERPFDFIRIDENRCGCAIPDGYNPACNTETQYTLYYFRQRKDGTLERVGLVSYRKGGLESDKDTDMQWVSPAGFEFEIPSDIYIAPDGTRTIFLDVRTLSGSSENGFNLWAGPRYLGVPGEVNARNAWLVEHPNGMDGAGAVWSGIGRVPLNSNTGDSDVLLTLAYIPSEWAGRTLTISCFDNDLSLAESLDVTIDSVPDWRAGIQLSGNGVWRHNAVKMPGQPEHTMYGGYLQIRYRARAAHDTFLFEVTGEASPVLIE